MKRRLDQLMVARALCATRSEAENWIRLGRVSIDGKVVTKPGYFVREDADINLKAAERYVSRAGLKLASVAHDLRLDFTDTIVLDVGSSTGGFTDYALQNGASKVIAVDVGTDQLHPSLRGDERIELHEKTNILDVQPASSNVGPPPFRPHSSEETAEQDRLTPAYVASSYQLSTIPDIVVMDLSFVSLRQILPHVAVLSGQDTQIVAMAKPQFEAGKHQVNKGVIKNDSVRRAILKEFEAWARQRFVIVDKADSEVAGSRGNRERFYLLKKLA